MLGMKYMQMLSIISHMVERELSMEGDLWLCIKKYLNNDSIFAFNKIKNYVGNTFGKMWQIESPVLAIFGTSS